MRKALVVGINHYPQLSDLRGCVNDATDMERTLRRNDNGTVNFDTRLITGVEGRPLVDRARLKSELRRLYADEVEIALFYFAGHGFVEDVGGYLCTADSSSGDDGLSLAELMTLAGRSPARHRVIILDSCHSGFAGNRADSPLAELRDGTTILTASTDLQTAKEYQGRGLFTTLLIDALEGAAANLMGDVTPGSLYAHVDLSLGRWSQRPVFKTNVKSFVSLRQARPRVDLADLQALPGLFEAADVDLPLDPAFEPARNPGQEDLPPPDPEKNHSFACLQRLVNVGLVEPVGEKAMYWAALHSKACRLTPLGRHYWQLAQGGRI